MIIASFRPIPDFISQLWEKKNNFLMSGSGLGTRLEQFCFSCTYRILAPHLSNSICISFIYSGRSHRWFHCICAWMTSLCLKHCILVKDRAHICFVVAPDILVPTQRCPKWKFSIVWCFKHSDWTMWWRLLRISATLAENVNFWRLSHRLMKW